MRRRMVSRECKVEAVSLVTATIVSISVARNLDLTGLPPNFHLGAGRVPVSM